jgi:DNA invertase Pin-like site-specific DNA recombinase
MKKAIAILRVSTDQQDTARQKKDVAAAARIHNVEITRTVELQDVSGTKVLGHAEIRRALADLAQPDVAGVVVSAIDRLIRPGELGDLQIFDAFQRSKKVIFTPAQVIDLNTQAGFLTSGIMGVIAGFERQMILARTSAGREIARQRGGNPCGSVVLPRGVTFSKLSGWSYVEPHASQVRKAYDLLFERRSWHDIANRVGGWSFQGIRDSLRNPIWKGVRRYTENREEPLEIKVIDPPLISPARWEAAQKIILEKRTRWAKTKHIEPRFLLSGLLQCSCGKSVYLRCGGKLKPRHYYRCSSAIAGRGPWCGATSVRANAADHVVEEIVSTELVDPAFLRSILSRYQAGQPARDENAGKLARQREKLEAERQRLLRMTLKGTCTEEDFSRESRRIEAEIRNLDRLAPVPVPAVIDPAKLVVRITRTFARFRKQPMEEKRGVLRAVFREIVLDNGALTTITINGGFLDGVNLSEPSSWP